MRNRWGILRVLSPLLAIPAGQLLCILLGQLLEYVPIPGYLGNVVVSIVYVLGTLAALSLISKKLLGMTLSECRVGRFFAGKTSKGSLVFWGIAGILLPVAVCGSFFLLEGEWVTAALDQTDVWMNIAGTVCYYGIATGIVEEAVMRGVLMSAVERRWNQKAAVIGPSVVFGLLHVIGADLSFVSILQLLAAGSVVGILFSLVTYATGSIWCSAWMHGVWNIFMAGYILNIGPKPDLQSVYSYVLKTDQFLLTGGEFGAEASVIAIAGYVIFAVIAYGMIRRTKCRRVWG